MGTSAVCKGLGGMGGIRRGPHECLISCPSESANMATTVAISYYDRWYAQEENKVLLYIG